MRRRRVAEPETRPRQSHFRGTSKGLLTCLLLLGIELMAPRTRVSKRLSTAGTENYHTFTIASAVLQEILPSPFFQHERRSPAMEMSTTVPHCRGLPIGGPSVHQPIQRLDLTYHALRPQARP